MPFVNLPDFVAKQKLTAAQLDQIVSALQNFSTQTGDITWPLTAGGDLDMDDSHTISGMRNFWRFYNVEEYSEDSNPLQAAIDDAESATGGACVFIPAGHTTGTTGVTISKSNITILGCGPTSVVQLESGNGPIIQCAATYTDLAFLNFAIDGNSTGSGVNAIKLQDNVRVVMDKLWVYGVVGDALYITNSGTSSEYCENIRLTNSQFRAGSSGSHIKVDDVINLKISDVESLSAASGAIVMEPDTSASYLQDIQLSGITVDGVTGKGISILSASGTADAKWSRISVSNSTVISATGDSIELGATSKRLKDVRCEGCSVLSAGADGLNINTEGGLVDGFYCPSAPSGNGFDNTGSTGLYVGTLGVPRADNAAAIIHKGGFLSSDSTSYLLTQGVDTIPGTFGYTLTIPADTVEIGDVVRIRAFFEGGGSTSGGGIRARLETVDIGSIAGLGADNTVMGEWIVFVEALSGAGSTQVIFSFITNKGDGSTEVDADDAEDITVDWTADVDLDFYCTALAAGTLDLRGITVELLGGV